MSTSLSIGTDPSRDRVDYSDGTADYSDSLLILCSADILPTDILIS